MNMFLLILTGLSIIALIILIIKRDLFDGRLIFSIPIITLVSVVIAFVLVSAVMSSNAEENIHSYNITKDTVIKKVIENGADPYGKGQFYIMFQQYGKPVELPFNEKDIQLQVYGKPYVKYAGNTNTGLKCNVWAFYIIFPISRLQPPAVFSGNEKVEVVYRMEHSQQLTVPITVSNGKTTTVTTHSVVSTSTETYVDPKEYIIKDFVKGVER